MSVGVCGEVRGDEWGYGKVWGRCGKCVGMWGEVRENERRDVLGCGKVWARCGEVLGEVWESVEEVWEVCLGCAGGEER